MTRPKILLYSLRLNAGGYEPGRFGRYFGNTTDPVYRVVGDADQTEYRPTRQQTPAATRRFAACMAFADWRNALRRDLHHLARLRSSAHWLDHAKIPTVWDTAKARARDLSALRRIAKG